MHVYNTPPSADMSGLWPVLSAYFGCLAIFMILFAALYIWVFWRILTKAGYSGWLSLLNLIGGLGTLVVLLILAFGDWPVFASLRRAPYVPPTGPGSQPYYPAPGYAPVAPPAPGYAPPAPPAPTAAPAGTPENQPPAPPAPPVQ